MRFATSLRVLQKGLPQPVPGDAKAQAFKPLQVPPQLLGVAMRPPSGGLIASASLADASIGAPASLLAPPAPPAPPLPALPPAPVPIENPAHSFSGSVFAG